MLVKNMPIISNRFWKNITHSHVIEREHITLGWNYSKRQVHLSMPKYVTKAVKQFQHIAKKHQYAPYSCIPIQYGAKKLYATQDSKATPLVDKAKQFIQQVCSKFLWGIF